MLADTTGLSGLPEEGLPVFHEAGGAADEDVVCSGCGYGVAARTILPPCPMCSGRIWEVARTSGFAASAWHRSRERGLDSGRGPAAADPGGP
jgi:hypothetical protein